MAFDKRSPDEPVDGRPRERAAAGAQARSSSPGPPRRGLAAAIGALGDRVARPGYEAVLPLGQVNLVGYHRDAWTKTPPEIEIAGQTVELVGLTSDEPNSVILVAKDHHIALLVIPPDIGEVVAERELKEPSKRGETGVNQAMVNQLAAKLARHEGSNDPRRLDQITKWCEDAAERFVDVPVQVFVPILIENMVRSRMYLDRTAATS